MAISTSTSLILPTAESNPAVPGAGAQRAVGIAQLYIRLTNADPLAITAVDALSLAFGAGGATISELASYLAVSEHTAQVAVEAVPADLHCTSLELEEDVYGGSGGQRKAGQSEEGEWEEADESGPGGKGSHTKKGEALRHYLNYKRILCVAYAHLSRLLLALCVTPLPDSPYTQKIRQTQMEAVLRSVGGASAPSATAQAATTHAGAMEEELLLSSSLNISAALRRKEALEGIYCRGCQYYFTLQDFDTSLSKCPTCRQDVLRLQVTLLKRRLDTIFEQTGKSLILVPRAAPQSSAAAASASGTITSTGGHAPQQSFSRATTQQPKLPSVSLAEEPGVNCALARDPFLLQQALAFLFLYDTPFASLNDARCVVDAIDILTEPEYEHRMRGKASLADEFRALHRNPNTVRVKLVSQQAVDEAIRADNAKKIAKRANLPPWLQHSTTLASLARARKQGDSTGSLLTASTALTLDDAVVVPGGWKVPAPGEGKPNEPGHEDNAATDRKRVREPTAGRLQPQHQQAVDKKQRLLGTAHFVASEFFEDDFDCVPLPRYTAVSGQEQH